MSVTIAIPSALEPYAGGTRVVRVDAPVVSVADALRALAEEWPGVVDRVLTEQGQVREHVNVFVGEESIRYCGGLAAPLREGDAIEIIAAVSGG